jgi:hypothetical protein
VEGVGIDLEKTLKDGIDAAGTLGLGDILNEAEHWGGKLLKGVAVVLIANEIMDKYKKASAASLPPGALSEYKMILAAHAATLADPSNGIGGGVAVDLAYRNWTDKHNITGTLREQLKPSESPVKVETARDLVRRSFYEQLPEHSPNNAPSGIRDLIAIKNQITEETDQVVEESSSLSREDLKAKQQEIKKLHESFDNLYDTEQSRGTITAYLQQRNTSSQALDPSKIKIDAERIRTYLDRTETPRPKTGI